MFVAEFVVRVGDQHARLPDRTIANHNCFEMLHVGAEMKLRDESGLTHESRQRAAEKEGKGGGAEEREWRPDRRRKRGGGE
jgi:hypothetical protein